VYFSDFTPIVLLIVENSDDEYRILRQNLFERFASNAAVPIETPIVPVAAQPRPTKAGATPDRRTFFSIYFFMHPLAYFSLSRCSDIATPFKFPG